MVRSFYINVHRTRFIELLDALLELDEKSFLF